jgi:hypothetical protein
MAFRLDAAFTRHGVAAALYAVLFLASLYPQSLRPWDTVAYIGDSLDTVYFMSWNAHQVVRDPLHLFDANILHPHRAAMTLAGHRILPGILAAPIIALSGNPILAYNLVLAVAYLLAALAGRRLAGLLGIDPVGAWAAGALYAFNTYQINEAPRADLLFHGFTALALGELLIFLRTGQPRRAWHVAGLMILQGLASTYLLLYGALVLTLVAAGALVARPRLVAPRLARTLPAAFAATLLFLPVILPHLRSARTYGFARDAPEGVDLKHYVSTQPTNLAYGEIFGPVRPQQKGPHFVGFVSLALALLAVLTHRRQRGPDGAIVPARTWVPAAAALAALLVALSLGREIVVFGHDLGPGPYRLLHLAVPGFQFIRIPERLGLLAMLFVALLAGRALTLLRASGPRLAPVAVALALAVPLEHLSPLPLTERIPVWKDVPAVYRWLARDNARAVAEVPIHGEGLIRKETLEEYFSTYHFKPIIHGYVSYPPLLSVLLRRAAADFPSESSVQALQRVGVDTVVVHHGRGQARGLEEAVAAAVAAGRLSSVARFSAADAHVYEGTMDEVVRLAPVPAEPAAAMPGGVRARDAAWRYSATAGNAQAAGDGDMSTAWTVPGELHGGEALEVGFGRSLKLAGVVLPLRRDSAFPTVLRIEGLGDGGEWGRLARLDGPHVLQLVDQLLVHPGEASLGFDLTGREAAGVKLLMAEGARGFDGWVIPELEVRVP